MWFRGLLMLPNAVIRMIMVLMVSMTFGIVNRIGVLENGLVLVSILSISVVLLLIIVMIVLLWVLLLRVLVFLVRSSIM